MYVPLLYDQLTESLTTTMYVLSVASSKHLQTRRFLDTLEEYLLEVQRTLIQLHRSSNECSAPFVDHVSVFHGSKSGRQTNHRD
jgi:carnitine O-acetyltransferase